MATELQQGQRVRSGGLQQFDAGLGQALAGGGRHAFGRQAHGLGTYAGNDFAAASAKNAIYDVVTRHFNGQIDDARAVAELASALAD